MKSHKQIIQENNRKVRESNKKLKGRQTNICPKCNEEYSEYPALSREDNETKICSACGTKEAIASYYKFNELLGGDTK